MQIGLLSTHSIPLSNFLKNNKITDTKKSNYFFKALCKFHGHCQKFSTKDIIRVNYSQTFLTDKTHKICQKLRSKIMACN